MDKICLSVGFDARFQRSLDFSRDALVNFTSPGKLFQCQEREPINERGNLRKNGINESELDAALMVGPMVLAFTNVGCCGKISDVFGVGVDLGLRL